MASTQPAWQRRQFLQAGALALGGLASATPAAPPASGTKHATAPPALSAFDWDSLPAGSLRRLPTRNSFLSQNPGLPGWQDAFGKLVDDYSGGVFNPYWGPLGAMVFHGGGHSATFDNSVVLLDLNDLRFKRVSNPTPPQGGGSGFALDPQTCEYADGQPGAGHTYDTLAILPPEAGGAACGTLMRVASFAVHVNASCNTGWAHRFDFPSTALRGGQWQRASGPGPGHYLFPGACSAYDPQRRRVWWMAGLSSLPGFIRYLDVAAQRQEEAHYSRGAPAPAADPDSTTLRYDPQRDWLVLSCTVQGAPVLACLACARPEAGWVVATLSSPLPAVPDAALAFDRLPQADRYVLLSPADPLAVYALQPPDALREPWAVTRQPLTQGRFATARVVGKRWSYCPQVNAFVWMASSTAPVMAYRPLAL